MMQETRRTEESARPRTAPRPYEVASFREDAWRTGEPRTPEELSPLHRTLPRALREAARLEEEVGLTILGGPSGGEDRHLSYRALHGRARRFAGGLETLGVKRGDRVLLVLADSAEFLTAFFGTQLLGALPVPAYPPVGPGLETGLQRLAHIAGHAGAEVCVTEKRLLPLLGDLPLRAPGVKQVVTARGMESEEPQANAVEVGPGDVAFLQYTSGSTGRPKGVRITHDNVVSNVHSVGMAIRVARSDRVVNWCPLYHDMGLVGGPLFTLYWRLPLVLLSPIQFVRRPSRWLRAIHDHHATLSFSPNFGYALAVRRVPEAMREGLDLSCWRVALNGAETVNRATVDAFVEAYRPYGFRPTTMMPVYGLAEATVAASFSKLTDPPSYDVVNRTALARGEAVPQEEGMAVANLGRPLPGQGLRVVNDEGRSLPDRKVGNVLVAGRCVMSGYHADPGETDRVLRDRWLWTGDLGYLVDGELHLTGRAKDVIILNGRNYYPTDLEQAAERVPGVRGGGSVAFPVYDEEEGRERVVLVCETREREEEARSRLLEAIRIEVQEASTVAVDHVVLVAPRTIPKTSSGKRQRALARERYLKERLRPARRGRLALPFALLRSGAGLLWMRVRKLLGR